ncbi:MAG: sigma 54-interacting transcriptional regulator [Chloracidobacterium sp.]|nr:sigma 54-interacting transcriptional regulator [Chloracidobacterium sp.]
MLNLSAWVFVFSGRKTGAGVVLALHKFCNSQRKLVKCLKTLTNNGSLALLAGYDFLDLCLLGETGTGKTHTARLIHDLSPRARCHCGRELCGTDPSVIEAELFGYLMTLADRV